MRATYIHTTTERMYNIFGHDFWKGLLHPPPTQRYQHLQNRVELVEFFLISAHIRQQVDVVIARSFSSESEYILKVLIVIAIDVVCD